MLFQRIRVNLRPNDKWGPPKELTEPEIISPEKLRASTENDIKPVPTKGDSDGFDNPIFHTKL